MSSLILKKAESMVLAVEAAGRSIKLMKNGDMKTEPELHKLTDRHEAEAGKKAECGRCGNKTQLELQVQECEVLRV